MARLFGTDGVRGRANTELTPELAFELGRAGAQRLSAGSKRGKLLICRDTRVSGKMLEAALAAGIASVGVDAVLVGVVPTPACAYLIRAHNAQGGAMISASHNPMEDNGIKFFDSKGFKLRDEVEDEIEGLLRSPALSRPDGAAVGDICEYGQGAEDYMAFLQNEVPLALDGLKIAVDCAHGAASVAAPELLRRFGADLSLCCGEPDGRKINDQCGSTHPETIQQFSQACRAAVGISYDGDADRVLLVDEKGNLVDGDAILAICARQMLTSGTLTGNKIAATVYSNGGLKQSLSEVGVDLELTAAGDRYVLEAMQQQGLALGGEQSGHVIFLQHNSTGDGILTSLKVLQAVTATGRPLSELASVLRAFPQVLCNVRVKTKENWQKNPAIAQVLTKAEMSLGPDGRIFVRPSGTEPVIRVMAEHPDAYVCRSAADLVAGVIEGQLG